MKKVVLLMMIICWMSVMFAHKVLLTSGQTLKGEIVGKIADTLYIVVDDQVQSVQKKTISAVFRSQDKNDKEKEFNRKDWLYDAYQAYLSPQKYLVNRSKSFAINTEEVDQMSERVYQLYQLKLNQDFLARESYKKRLFYSGWVAAFIITGIVTNAVVSN